MVIRCWNSMRAKHRRWCNEDALLLARGRGRTPRPVCLLPSRASFLTLSPWFRLWVHSACAPGATPTPPVPVPPVSGSDAAWCPVRSSILFTPPARSFCQGCARYVPIRLTSPSPSSILFSMTYEESACKNMKAKYLYSAYKETKDLSRISPKCKEGRSSFELCPYF